MILALDCASVTGWANVGKDGRLIESGVQDFRKRRGESNGIMFLRFRKWLTGLVEALPEKPSVLVYEQAHFRGGAATEICVGLQTRVQEVAAAFGIESAPVTTETLKLFACGHGRVGKDRMIEAAETILRKHGHARPPLDDNEADAIHAAMWGYDQYGWTG